MISRPRRLLVRVFSSVVRLFPAGFREHFGQDMVLELEDSLSDAPTRTQRVRVAARAFLDLGRSLAREHWEARVGREGMAVGGLLDDVRRAVRSLVRTPGFTVAVLLTLALGIGATTAIYSVVHGVLLAPLPYPDADRIVTVSEKLEDGTDRPVTVSFVNAADWKAGATSLDALARIRSVTLALTGAEEAVRLEVLFADPEYFDILDAETVVGRLPTAEENVTPSGHPVAVMSHRLWQERYGGDPGMVGQSMQLGGVPYTVIGVLTSDHREPFPSASGMDTDLWIPSMMSGQVDRRGDNIVTSRSVRAFSAIARLAPGSDIGGADAELNGIADALEADHPGINQGFGVLVTDLAEALTTGIRSTVLLLMGGAVILLMIACFNVANLLLVRGSARSQELAVQLALGAGRGRLLRLLGVEGLLLAVLGGALGVIAASAFLPLLLTLVPTQLPPLADITLSTPVLIAASGISVLCGALFGVVPAVRLSSVDLRGSLSGGRGAVGGRHDDRLRGGLILFEIATATVLLSASTLLVSGFRDIRAMDTGFVTDRLLTMRVTLAPANYPDEDDVVLATQTLMERIEELPDVEWARPWGPSRPGLGAFLQSTIPEGMVVERLSDSPLARRQHVGPGTLERMGIPILRGRGITAADRPGVERVAVVSESMAEELWPGEDAIGKRFKGFVAPGRPREPWREWMVVGVAADARNGGRVPPPGAIVTANDAYFSISQRPERTFTVLVRSRGQPRIEPVRAVIGDFDRDIPVSAVASMHELLAEEEGPALFGAILMGAFALSALVLAGLGVYGMVAFSVVRRTREIGLRAALGALPGSTIRHFMGHAAKLGLAGVSLGGLLAVLTEGVVRTLLSGVPEVTVTSLVIAAGVLLTITLVACFIPALRATRIAPVIALRE